MAMIIYFDGTTKNVPLKEVRGLTAMQEIVGGYIEFFYLPDGICLVVNEEGKLRGLPPNFLATDLCHITGKPETIVGNAILFSADEMKKMEEDT